MGIEIDVLALENWFDLFAFLSRPQLGQLASSIGNRRFASIVQGFLHKYVRQITLGGINLAETKNGDENDHSRARVILWQKYRWGREEFPVADWPMPENITDFEAIQLSYLDTTVLRFLQIFQQNALFTNVNLYINIMNCDYKNVPKIAQCLSHLIPMITSIDSIEFKGCALIDAIIDKWFDLRLRKYRLKYPGERWKLDYAQVVACMIAKARIIEISDFGTGIQPFDWLCHWLYTKRDDRKAKCLLLLGRYINNGLTIAFIVRRIKKDFCLAKEAVSYFIGIRYDFLHGFKLETVTNSRTNERMTVERRRLINLQMRPNHPLVLISRYPLDVTQEWIDANEKVIVERNLHKGSRKIELDGLHWANITSESL